MRTGFGDVLAWCCDVVFSDCHSQYFRIVILDQGEAALDTVGTRHFDIVRRVSNSARFLLVVLKLFSINAVIDRYSFNSDLRPFYLLNEIISIPKLFWIWQSLICSRLLQPLITSIAFLRSALLVEISGSACSMPVSRHLNPFSHRCLAHFLSKLAFFVLSSGSFLCTTGEIALCLELMTKH